MRLGLLLCAVALGCGSGGPDVESEGSLDPGPTAVEEPVVVRDPDLRVSIESAIDARQLSELLRNALRSDRVENRRAAANGLAQLQSWDALPLLSLALRDPDGRVRQDASLGISTLPDRRLRPPSREPDEREVLILGALASEHVEEVAGVMIRDLGRVGGESSLEAILGALASELTAVRVQACQSLGQLARREVRLTRAAIRRLSARMVDDPEVEVRRACAYSLRRSHFGGLDSGVRQAVLDDIRRALGQDDAEIRLAMIGVLERLDGLPRSELVARAFDNDWRVRAAAIQSLSRTDLTRGTAFAEVMARLVEDLPLSGPQSSESMTILRVLALAAQRHGRMAPVQQQALRVLRNIERVAESGVSDDLAYLHCDYSMLADMGREWTDRVERCGLGRVPASERAIRAAAVIGAAREGDANRRGYLERLLRDSDPRVRQAAIAAGTRLEAIHAAPILEAGLADDDFGVQIKALEQLQQSWALWRANGVDLDFSRFRPAILRLTHEMADSEQLEGLQAALRALAMMPDAAAFEILRAHGAHRNVAVRNLARRLLRENGQEAPRNRELLPAGAPGSASGEPVHADAQTATISTTRGPFQIRFMTAEAPRTVSNFVRLAETDYYDGLRFHRVIPGFMSQGGDPRGDGYGGPPGDIRCETNRLTYRRGAVGMALAGRDTGGGQFFVTHAESPHLDGNYTQFAQVIQGQSVVEQLAPHDRILDVTVHRTP